MGIMVITSREKNPMIKCEWKQHKIQKSQKIMSSEISTKMHEKCE